ncbi:zinc finger MYM-type protein 1-like [Temnothorax americanus]|uniref:zinc finger MYM-type protein 1-like n=1 Tax=Temnothorax americanus TaxID=1964332 RepID=UPI00406790E1
MESPASATSLLESKDGSSTIASQAKKEGKLDKSEYDDMKSEAAKENVDMTGKENDGDDDYDVEFIDEIKPDDTKISKLDGTEKLRTVIPEIIEQHDIGLLKFDKNTEKAILPDALKTEIIKLGSKYFQNSEGPFQPTNNRSMNKTWFKRKLGTCRGKEVTRSWLIYSPSKKSAFCICCLLFSQLDHQSTLEQENGFKQWKAPERISMHKNAKNHRECFTQWKEMERNLVANSGVIDAELRLQIEREKQKWRDILTRILHCIKFLATQNLALRGHRKSFQLDDDSNVGNFLDLLKLLAIFDPVMKEHLTHVENYPRSTTYLSPSVQNEFIHLMASTVRQNLLRSIRKAKYYGLIFDSTPDQAHREQMSEVVRYVEVDFERKTVRIRESFLGFIHISRKNAEGLVEDILQQLEKDEMELQDCRSQCYDNAAVMAGHKSGVHQRISEKNNLAIFVNCNNHSLNLVGVHAAKQDIMMVTFFGVIEALYVFFSHSTQRWEKLKNAVPVVVKSESETRWSARTEAVKPVNKYFEEILQVFLDMIDNVNETSETRSDAKQLYNQTTRS